MSINSSNIEQSIYCLAYRCLNNNPLDCNYLQQTLTTSLGAKFCSKCAFPLPLSPEVTLRGQRGTYQITQFIGKRGNGRLYVGKQNNDNQKIIIKEYLLPNRCFSNLEDVQHRQETFIRITNIKANDGRERDFRLILPWEGIADLETKRCYIITKTEIANLPSMRKYLQNNTTITPETVKKFLDQVLQTLEFLHQHKFQFSSGQVKQGLTHGALNLDNLLIDSQNFFIYLTDLYLWESLFDPSNSEIEKTPSDDLKALGEIASYLLSNQVTNQQDEQKIYTPLNNFIRHLLGEKSPFISATQAREALRQLPSPQSEVTTGSTSNNKPDSSVKSRWWLSVGIPLLLLLGILSAWFLLRRSSETTVKSKLLTCCIRDISKVPTGNFTYTTDSSGNYAIASKLFFAKTESLAEQIEKKRPGLSLVNVPTIVKSEEEAIAQIKLEKANFAVIGQSKAVQLVGEFSTQAIAYDGIAIFVPFSYKKRDKSLPQALSGQISIEQLKQIYTGKIKNWQEIGGSNLMIDLYIPQDALAIKIFQERVLQNDQESIAIFEELRKTGKIKQEETGNTIRILQTNFEDQKTGGISFGFYSKIFGQCGNYPLALQIAGKTVQPLIDVNNQPITPNIDLCKKGSYKLAQDLLRSTTTGYQLSFPLVVLYPNISLAEDKYQIGRKFAEIMQTKEVQQMLSEINLIPLQPLK